MAGWPDGRMAGWLDSWMAGWLAGWMDGWMDGHINIVCTHAYVYMYTHTHTCISMYTSTHTHIVLNSISPRGCSFAIQRVAQESSTAPVTVRDQHSPKNFFAEQGRAFKQGATLQPLRRPALGDYRV